MHRALLHIDDAAQIDRGLRSVQHLLDDLGDEVAVILVVNGGAVSALRREATQTPVIRRLLEQGVTIAGCRHSLLTQKIDPASLVEGVRVVQSGVGELVRREGEGFAYIKL